ncbi:uncharacterized protein BCR38DRAFT_460511 [Pseudomassariella vexata]|uniref:DUF8021 domain-containing protein n=1 Tax=Pseudomassariella vexata TaxID=1141098 RepID=A0A1Y2DJ21_9PEZI|nr:uncharacterized protein BCR38DRAFT_460511 [Pseudomassariella vexata]ORY59176.1 hypothetical protein BCR38DRAFT_460511 [Pseudomassariella vexata]
MIQLLISASLVASCLAAPASVAVPCDLTTLTSTTSSYIAAQAAGSTTQLPFLGSPLNYTENFKSADVTRGILATPLKIDHNHSLHDTTACSTYMELIVTNSEHPYVLGTQMETIVTDRGDWLFNATGTLSWASKENWGVIPEGSRDTRAVIQAAADAYADVFNDKSVVVPWGTPWRLEGGSYTGSGAATDRCDVGIPNGVKLTRRRYVIDELLGSVDLFMDFGNGLPDSHEFRVEGGKIRYVHTLTATGG